MSRPPVNLLAVTTIVAGVLLGFLRPQPMPQAELQSLRLDELPNDVRHQRAVFQTHHGDEPADFSVDCISASAANFSATLVDLRDATDAPLAAAMGRTPRGVGAVNGGYFSAKFAPVGLSRVGGVELSPESEESLLSGFVACGDDGRVRLLKRDDAETKAQIKTSKFVRQAGPFLIGPTETIGNRRARAERTVIAVSRDRVALISTSPVSLDDLADALLDGETLGIPRITQALNLDGGPSSGMVYVGRSGNAGSEPRSRVTDAIVLQRRF